MSSAPTRRELIARLDPEIAEAMRQAKTQPFELSTETLHRIRAERVAQYAAAPLSDAVERRVVTIPGPEGAPPVDLRVHRPAGVDGPLPCVYWMHGGGYVLSNAQMDDPRFDRWCPALGCVGVSVEYRLAPETPYPGPLEDAYAGLRWVHEHADELGIVAGNIGIGGSSAGAGLASGLSLLARDRGEVPLAYQLLIYPMLDDRMVTRSSQWEVPVWPPDANRFGWSSYLGPLYETDEVPPYAAAARATDLRGLPPTYLSVGTLDGFFDEDVDYALRLDAAGVPTELHVYPGAPHGFEVFWPDTAVSRRARHDMREWVAYRVRS